ncbi:MAG TPA: MerR family transcriptional regulator [Microlunatus sp.]
MDDSGEPADRLMSIGVFSRRSWLSMRALRLYDQQGLLSPAAVDSANGYRWYRESQLFTARMILLLRQLDMPLAQVAELVRAPDGQSVRLLEDYWAGVERRIAGQRNLVAILTGSLAVGEEPIITTSFTERDVPEQTVICERSQPTLRELEPWLRATKQRLTAAAAELGGSTGRLFVIYHGAVNADSDGPVEVCVPVDPDAVPEGFDPTARIEAAHREAYLPVTKAQFELPQILSVYDAIRLQCEAAGRIVVGPGREVYLDDVDPDRVNLDELVCEVAYPVR